MKRWLFVITIVAIFFMSLNVIATSPEVTVVLKIGDNIAYVNGIPINLDVPPLILPPGRTMVPIRFISESLGAKVSWDPLEKKITIRMDSVDYLKEKIDNLQEILSRYKNDATSPKIYITEPKGNIVNVPEIYIKGRIEDDNGVKAVYINENKGKLGDDNKFEVRVSLKPGKNRVLIVATDLAGNVSFKNLDILYNRPPEQPTNPYPSNNAIDIPTEISLSWECKDMDEDKIFFDIYFGEDESPPKIEGGYNKFSYLVSDLKYNTTYYWYVVARDEKGGITKGPLWKFTTKPLFSIEKYYIPGANIRQVLRRGNDIYAATDDGDVYKLNLEELEWEEVFKSSAGTKRMNVYNGVLYILCSDNKIYNVDKGEKVYELPWLDRYGCYDFLITKNRIYAVYYGYTHDFGLDPVPQGKGVIYSEDGGTTWKELNEGLLHESILKIKMSKDERIFCSGWSGIYELNNDKWNLLFSTKYEKSLFVDFDFFYEDDGSLEKIYAVESRDLYEYDIRRKKVKVYNHDGALPQSLYIDQDKNIMITTYWMGGVATWNLSDMKYEVFLKSIILSRSAVSLNQANKIIVGCFGGYFSSFLIDLDSKEYKLVNEGFTSYPDIRGSGFFKKNLVLGSIRGLISFDVKTKTHNFILVQDDYFNDALHEPHYLTVYKGKLYFQDVGYGIWETENLKDFRKLPLGLNDFKDEPIKHKAAAGLSFYITKEDKIYVSPTYETQKYGTFRCFDFKTGKLLYTSTNLPPVDITAYAMPTNLAVCSDNEDIVALDVLLKLGEPYKLFISRNGGKDWEFIDDINNPSSLKFVHEDLYYINMNKICKYNIKSKNIEEIMDLIHPVYQFDIYKNYFIGVGGGYILVYDMRSGYFIWISDSDATQVSEVKAYEKERCIIICGQKVIRINMNDS